MNFWGRNFFNFIRTSDTLKRALKHQTRKGIKLQNLKPKKINMNILKKNMIVKH